MTRAQAETLIAERRRVESTDAGDDNEAGWIHRLIDDETAMVGWDSGVATPCALSSLRAEDE